MKKEIKEFIWFVIFLAIWMIGLMSIMSELRKDHEAISHSNTATAGVITYLAELSEQSVGIDISEEHVSTVGAGLDYVSPEKWNYEIAKSEAMMEQATQDVIDICSDIPETEEEVIENEGSSRLEDYFGYTPSDDELSIWQRAVMAECGNTEPDDGIRAVADVIANRVRSSRFPNTITGVIYQKNQFETVSNGAIWKYEPTDSVLDICADCISEGVTYDYLFFTAGGYNPYCRPGGVIGHHYFGW